MVAVDDAGEARTLDGFAAVYDVHHRRLLRIAYLIRGDLTASEDDVAEAFAKTLAPWLAGRVEDVGAYLRAAVINQTRTWVRREARRQRWASTVVQPPLDGVEDRVIDREYLRRALDVLPHGQRVAVVLRFVDDASEADAAAMGVTIGTVKSQTARGLASLRRALQEEPR